MKFTRRDVVYVIISSVTILGCALWLEDVLANGRSRIPGFQKIDITEKCCKFHKEGKGVGFTYEPVFVRLLRQTPAGQKPVLKEEDCDQSSHITLLDRGSLNFSPRMKYKICQKTAKTLFNVFQKIKNSLGINGHQTKPVDFTEVKISHAAFGAFESNVYFVSSGDKLLCLLIQGWVLPIVCRFNNIAGGVSPLLNVAWNFTSFNTIPNKDGYIITLNLPFHLTLDLLCHENIKIIEIEKKKFSIKSGEIVADSTGIHETMRIVPFTTKGMLLTVKKPQLKRGSAMYIFMCFSYILIVSAVVFSWFALTYSILKGTRGVKMALMPFFVILLSFSVCSSGYILYESITDG